MVTKRSYASCIAQALLFGSLSNVFLVNADMQCNSLIGSSSVGNGIITGVASVVTGLKQIGKICAGDIVIAHTTDSSWDSALKMSAGIIIEKDSSHALLLGKQLGIPVIVGVAGATKKIAHGSMITLDCFQRTIYKAANSDFLFKKPTMNMPRGCGSSYFTHLVYGQQPLHSPIKWMYESGSDEQISTLFAIDVTTDVVVKNDNKTNSHVHNGIEYTLNRLLHDKLKIKDYIVNEVGRNIARSQEWYVTKQMACTFGGISEKVYNSRPLEFFKNKSEIEKVSDLELSDPDAVEYIWGGIVAFIQQGVPVTNETLGNFLFDKLVDNMKIEEDQKKALKSNPVEMNDLVKKPGNMRDEYMKFNVRNLSIQYYLEKYYK